MPYELGASELVESVRKRCGVGGVRARLDGPPRGVVHFSVKRGLILGAKLPADKVGLT
jgi:hypothetical protein